MKVKQFYKNRKPSLTIVIEEFVFLFELVILKFFFCILGRLKTNNKKFDGLKDGAPFKFKLGKGQVIKGWDLGVMGMKVGGKRRLTIPPKFAYGASGAPPDIPPNSTLVFDIECKFVK